MAKGFKCGGGANPLNFKVVGNPRPEAPRENTIWVDTDEKITGWVFGAAQPETAEDGMVWFFTGTASLTEFNALKKNGITVYPLSAKQYVNGVWVDKNAKIYQNGSWKSWILYLYSPGNEQLGITGGWVTRALPISSDDSPGEVLDLTIESSGITVKARFGGGALYCQNKIDLTPFRTLTFSGVKPGTEQWRAGLYIWTDFGTYRDTNAVAKHAIDADTFSIDVSALYGEHIIGLCSQGSISFTMKELKLE